jgi:hypothetical protein
MSCSMHTDRDSDRQTQRSCRLEISQPHQKTFKIFEFQHYEARIKIDFFKE